MKTDELAEILKQFPGANVAFENIGGGFGDSYSIKDIKGYRLEEADFRHDPEKERQGIYVRRVVLSNFKIKPNL